jgi:fructokinase
VRAIRDLVAAAEARFSARGSVGVAIPGTISAKTGLVKNANSTCLIGHPLDRDLAAQLERPVRVANDANCFALSEASDGAGRHAQIVFGVIAGTGVGGGVCVRGHVLTGAHAIAGEWGHNPLPAPRREELPGPACYCGRTGCIEAWCSGPALSEQFLERTGVRARGSDIAQMAEDGDSAASAVMDAFLDRLARALAGVVNILDPDAIVMGGGLSHIAALYRELPYRIADYAFTPEGPVAVLKNEHGDSSGVRGAAWLWQIGESGTGR